MNKISKSLLIATSVFASYSAHAANADCAYSPTENAFMMAEGYGSTCISSSSLNATSPASVSSQIVSAKLNAKLKSKKQQRAQVKMPPTFQADLKYEQGKLSAGGSGDIEGITASFSTELAGTEVGLYVPYDYLDFKSFSAHRVGALAYAKRDWQLPSSLQLSTLIHINTLSTYLSEPGFSATFPVVPTEQHSTTNTLGGGFGTALTYDNGGDFVPRAMFAFQYSQDYYDIKGNFKDSNQYLLKFGGSVGYHLLDNATLNAGVVYNLDVTSYQNSWNQQKDKDYFDLTFGGSYAIADMWQVTVNYKRILGLTGYHSNAVFLGSTLGF